MKAAEYEAMLREMPCIISGRKPVTLHHVIGASVSERLKTVRGGRKASDFLQLPLHHDYHQGNQGIHTILRSDWEHMFGTEAELLDKLISITGIDAWALAAKEAKSSRENRKYKKPSKINSRR